MADQKNKISSGRDDDELEALLGDKSSPVVAEQENDVVTEQEVYVAKLHIRQKQKGDNLRALGSRVPTWMIDDLKLLADHLEVHTEDLAAGVLEQVLNDNMEAVYRKIENDARKRRRNLKS